jgi:hypothetical protein
MSILLHEKKRRARKVHPCSTCGGPAAAVGELYVRSTYIYDDHIYDWVTCSPCRDITNAVYSWAYLPEEGITAEDYHEWAVAHEKAETPNGEAARAYLARESNDSEANA